MNGFAVDELIVTLSTDWQNAVASRIALGVVGALIVLLVVRSFVKGSGSLLGRLLWLIAGSVVAAFAVMPVEMIHFVISTEYVIRIRVIMGGLSLLVLLITLETIRRTQLQERYALLWIATALVLFLCLAFPHAVDLFRAVTGMSYVGAIVSVMFTFLVLVAFHFSVSLSAMQSRHTKLSQRIAILDARLREVERQMAGQEAPCDTDGRAGAARTVGPPARAATAAAGSRHAE
jgi:hypothetical protein